MRYRRYIQGNRRGREANRVEREAMHDPFLAEALEGYDRMKDDPTPQINMLRRKIRFHNQRRLDIFKYGGIAASLLFILGFGIYFGFHKSNFPEEAIALQETFEQEQIEKPATGSIEDAIAQNQRQKERVKGEAVPTPAPAVQSAPPPVAAKPDELEIVELEEDMAMEEIAMEDSAIEEEKIAIADEITTLSAIRQQRESVAADSGEVIVIEQQNHVAKSLRRAQEINASGPVVGSKAYLKYIREKMIRPADDCKDIKGKVTLSFSVDKSGKPYDIKVEKSLCPSADKEAVRLIKEGPLWTPSETKMSYTIKF